MEPRIAMIITGSVISAVVIFLIYLARKIKIREEEKVDDLFHNKLIPACENAQTIEDCREAWALLKKECLNKNNVFNLPRSNYLFYCELKSYLRGKYAILIKQKP